MKTEQEIKSFLEDMKATRIIVGPDSTQGTMLLHGINTLQWVLDAEPALDRLRLECHKSLERLLPKNYPGNRLSRK